MVFPIVINYWHVVNFKMAHSQNFNILCKAEDVVPVVYQICERQVQLLCSFGNIDALQMQRLTSHVLLIEYTKVNSKVNTRIHQ